MLNIEKSFVTDNLSVYGFFNQPGQGLYIPLYQRDYSWDEDNIEQLLEDIARGISRLANREVSDDSKEIRFLGTIITVVESNRNNIYPVDPQAVPGRIEKIIDGQQRVSTIALMSTLLLKRLLNIKKKVKVNNPLASEIQEIITGWSAKLRPLFLFDLQRGTPTLKPKIVRGAKDFWTRDKSVDDAYKSELSNYLGHFIDALVADTELPAVKKQIDGNNLLYKNAKQINDWLEKDVAQAHEMATDNFAVAEQIVENISQDLLWDYERPNLVSIIKLKDFSSKRTDSYILSELAQTVAVCHYLLDRCCFTVIQPTDDDWAFDMFQSLNATGTPLTAIETFKPTIVNTTENETGGTFKGSNSEKYYKKVEDYLSKATTAQQKSKWTNDLLTSFYTSVDGRTMSTHFSYQRKALDKSYSDLPSFSDKERFISEFGNYAEFIAKWNSYTGDGGSVFPGIEGQTDADIASMFILFLKESNHKMAITVLARMYNHVICGHDNAKEDFIETAKLIGSYFFLWRSALSNSGLDSSYRDFFKELNTANKQISIDEVKTFVKSSLSSKGINTLDCWKHKAKEYLNYKSANKSIVRLALLATSHDTQPYNKSIKIARQGTSPYLTLSSWISDDLKTIEHVAPQTNESGAWSSSLYDDSEIYHDLGNLTLLPQDLNSSAGNKGWKEKQLYYRCVSESDSAVLISIINEAALAGISMNSGTIDLLKNCSYSKHLEPIAKLPSDIDWDATIVNQRTADMLDIIWERLSFAIK